MIRDEIYGRKEPNNSKKMQENITSNVCNDEHLPLLVNRLFNVYAFFHSLAWTVWTEVCAAGPLIPARVALVGWDLVPRQC